LKTLVLGGYGFFGTIIAATLARSGPFEVTVAGRDGQRAAGAARTLGVHHARLDIAAPGLADDLAALQPGLVIDTVGPFQQRDHAVARAAIAAGAHYVDLADARDYVCAVTALDAEARARGVLVVSGASSVPALTGAVVDRYAGDFGAIREIEAGISSSARVPGAATVTAMLCQCGRPFTQWRDGAWSIAHGAQALRRRRFAQPGMSRWIGDTDVPDLALFPARYPGVRSVRFGAGVELTPVQWSFWLFSWLVRAGLVRDAPGWAPLLMRGATMVQGLGTGRSALFVVVRGTDRSGAPIERGWELLATGNEGANVPCMAAVALARKLARPDFALRGAMPCVGLLTLEEYLHELEPFDVRAHEVH
jgi:hypothetical protein